MKRFLTTALGLLAAWAANLASAATKNPIGGSFSGHTYSIQMLDEAGKALPGPVLR